MSRSRSIEVAFVAIAGVVGLGAGFFLLHAEAGAGYSALAAFYMPVIAPLVVAFGGVEVAPRWAWYLAYVGGPLVQNILLAWLLLWLYRRRRRET